MKYKIVEIFGILLILNSVKGIPLVRNQSLKLDQEHILTLQDKQILFLEKLREETRCDENQNQCLNGGQCFGNQCYCPSPYIGPYCQFYLQVDAYLDEYIFAIMCLLSVIIGFLLLCTFQKYRIKKSQEYMEKFGEYYGGHFEIWERPNGQNN